jgi:hypothetical protein
MRVDRDVQSSERATPAPNGTNKLCRKSRHNLFEEYGEGRDASVAIQKGGVML